MTIEIIENNSQLNQKYLVQLGSNESRIPAIQISNYRPGLNEEVTFVIADTVAEMLGDAVCEKIVTGVTKVVLGGEAKDMGVLSNAIRFVILGIPKLFASDKTSGEVTPLEKGIKLGESNKVTIAKLLLVMYLDGDFIRNSNNEAVIFGLNLKSTRTALIGNFRDSDGGKARNNGQSTLAGLNQALSTKMKTKGLLTHLVSVKLKPECAVFKSNKSKDSVISVRYAFDGGAQILPDKLQSEMFGLLKSDHFKDLSEDPFGIAQKNSKKFAIVNQDDAGDGLTVAF